MLTKSQFFYFFSSSIITFVAGFFLWNVFVIPDGGILKQVLGQKDQVFTASVLSTDLLPQLQEEPVLEETLADQGAEAPQLSFQDQLDEIQEKLDVISQQVQELVAEQNQDNLIDEKDKDDEEEIDEQEKTKEAVVCTGQININTASENDLDKITEVGPATATKIIAARPFYSLEDLLKVSGIGEATLQKIKDQGCAFVESGLAPPAPSGGGGGSSAPDCKNLSNILISEFQVEGETASDDWVELYNPNDDVACLDGWSMQKASSTGKISRIKNFASNALIPAKGYYLIADSGASQGILQIADMNASSLDLSAEFAGGNTIYLVSKEDEIIDGSDDGVIDMVGYGLAKNFEILPAIKAPAGKSTGRTWDEVNQTYLDINNNSVDFELQTPTPKAQNIKYVESLPPLDPPAPTPTLQSIAITTPADKLVYVVGDLLDITGLVVTGTYSDGSTQVETITDTDVSGFDSSVPVIGQILTITISGQTATYTIDIAAPVVQKNILINEIQIAGHTAADEFIELYNPNDTEIDLSGYALKKKTSSGTESNLVSSASFSGIIPALGYFLIAPQANDDGTEKYTGQAVPDLRYSGKSYSVASNNTVLLYDSSEALQDKVGFGSAGDFETAVAPEPDDGQSISRTAGADTNDNSVDFIILDTPTPKE